MARWPTQHAISKLSNPTTDRHVANTNVLCHMALLMCATCQWPLNSWHAKNPKSTWHMFSTWYCHVIDSDIIPQKSHTLMLRCHRLLCLIRLTKIFPSSKDHQRRATPYQDFYKICFQHTSKVLIYGKPSIHLPFGHSPYVSHATRG